MMGGDMTMSVIVVLMLPARVWFNFNESLKNIYKKLKDHNQKYGKDMDIWNKLVTLITKNKLKTLWGISKK
jgi:hypothetical protein